MGIVVFFILWYFLIGRNDFRLFDKVKRNKKYIIPAIIALSIFSGNSGFFILTVLAAMFGIPIYILYALIKAASPDKKKAQQERNQKISKEDQLPNAVPKRIKIVEKFNTKYQLNLTPQQIQTMVDSSYISTDWEYLIHSMTKEYNTIHQWYRVPIGGWLRVYLKVFNVQVVSSDMAQQKKICLDSFDEIFRSIDLSLYNTPAWDINAVNNKFMTNFDDNTFMIAYRFLEANGRKYSLGKVKILKADEELSDLKEKYDSPTGQGTTSTGF